MPPRGLHLTPAFILLSGWMKRVAPTRERLEWLFKNELSLSLSLSPLRWIISPRLKSKTTYH